MTTQEFETVYNQYYKFLSYLAYQLINDSHAAEDIAQDAMLKLWNSPVEHHKSVKSFLYTTVKNTCYNYLRHLKVVYGAKDDLAIMYPSIEDSGVQNKLIKAEVMQWIGECIDGMPTRAKQIFILTWIYDMKNPEIAELLKISMTCVKTQKQRMILRMRQYAIDNDLSRDYSTSPMDKRTDYRNVESWEKYVKY